MMVNCIGSCQKSLRRVENDKMWVIKNIKYGNFYCSKVGENNHFVTRIEESKRWRYKADARKFLKDNMRKIDNFELVKVK